MPKSATLSDVQKKAIALLLAGKTHKQVAEDIGVSSKTIQRWKAAEGFQLEMKRRKELGDRAEENLEIREVAIAQLPPDEPDEWLEELDSHVEWLKKSCSSIKTTGINAVIKAARRLRDLPDEALKPADAIALYRLGLESINVGAELESELLGIRELAERVSGSQAE